MEIGEIAAGGFQALVVAEITALVVAHKSMDRETARSLGPNWHRRLEALTLLVRPVLLPAVLVVFGLMSVAVLGAGLGWDLPTEIVVALPALPAGLLTWWTARTRDWDRAGRSAARSAARS